MSETPLQRLAPEEALQVLSEYAARNFGPQAQVASVTFREDFQVWEGWVSGVEGYVKAYIVRLAPSNEGWICRHVTVMDKPIARPRED